MVGEIAKPVKYKKAYVEALRRFNELEGINIPESDIGNLTIGKQISIVSTLDESNKFTAKYLKIVKTVEKEFEHNLELKALHILNERTGKNLPDDYIDSRKYHTYPESEEYNENLEIDRLFLRIKKELIAKEKMEKRGKKIPEGYQTCGRCGGTGSYSWNRRDGSTCYGCGGSGTVPIKKKTGKGWKEAPDHTGKAPIHKIVATRRLLKDTLREPMVKQEE